MQRVCVSFNSSAMDRVHGISYYVGWRVQFKMQWDKRFAIEGSVLFYISLFLVGNRIYIYTQRCTTG